MTIENDTAGTLLRRCVHGTAGTADDPVAWYEGNTFTATSERVMRPDWQGSIVLVTDSTGSTIHAINRHDEYGIPQTSNAGRLCSLPQKPCARNPPFPRLTTVGS